MDAHDTAEDGRVSTEVRGRVLLIGLDRPAKLNGVTPPMMAQLVDAYERLDTDPDLWAGVVFGHGPHFTAGLDLPRWTEAMAAGGTRSATDRVDPMAFGRGCRTPVIFAVSGITYTVGIELMLAGDIVIAADDCRFAQLEPKRGIHATGGATFRFVERAGWGNAMRHLLTGDEFDATEAHRIGLVQEIVPAGAELDRALELAEAICSAAPLAVQATKASARRFVVEGRQACIEALAPTQAELMATADATEGVASFVERRPARFEGR